MQDENILDFAPEEDEGIEGEESLDPEKDTDEEESDGLTDEENL